MTFRFDSFEMPDTIKYEEEERFYREEAQRDAREALQRATEDVYRYED